MKYSGFGIPPFLLKKFGFAKNNANDFVFGTRRRDDIEIETPTLLVSTGRGADHVEASAPVVFASLGRGADGFVADDFVWSVDAGRGNDTVALNAGGSSVDLGRGRDTLKLSELIDHADGGRGKDTISFDFNAGDVDVKVVGKKVILIDRFSGEEMVTRNFETFEFADRTFSKADIETFFGHKAEYSVGFPHQNMVVNLDRQRSGFL